MRKHVKPAALSLGVWLFLFAAVPVQATAPVNINEELECTPHNRVTTEEEKLQHQRCNVRKNIFSKYREYIRYVNKMNELSKPITDYKDVPHPLTYISLLERKLKELDVRTEEHHKTKLNLEALRIVYDNIKLYPVQHSIQEMRKMEMEFPEAKLDQKTAEGAFLENKRLYEYNKRQKNRHDMNLFYTRALYFQKLIDKMGFGGDMEEPKLDDFQKMREDIYKSYNAKYAKYIYVKNNMNLRRRMFADDNYEIFKEHAKLKRELEVLEDGTDTPSDLGYLETRYKTEVLAQLISQIKLFPTRIINIQQPKVAEAIKNIVRKGYSYKQLEILMLSHEEKRQLFKKYRSQYWYEYHNVQYGLYRYILENRLQERGVLEKFGDWFL